MKTETWFNNKWRPAMGWTYMITCVMDFIVFPVAWNLLQASLGQPLSQWQPLTLQGAGLYHMAMGAVVGVTAWKRSQEKMAQNIQPD
jgi:Holin of 3TMs, for gene-transfer release